MYPWNVISHWLRAYARLRQAFKNPASRGLTVIRTTTAQLKKLFFQRLEFTDATDDMPDVFIQQAVNLAAIFLR